MKEVKYKNKDFLQSDEWRAFQESAGKRTFFVSGNRMEASIVEHKLPWVGSYFYIPRGFFMKTWGPLRQASGEVSNKYETGDLNELISLAEKENAGWIRLDIDQKEELDLLKKNIKNKIKKAPHDMQPRQVFVIDISGTEEEILSNMKPKTRYNIRLASKKGVTVKKGKEYIEEFLRLVKITSDRKGITAHPEDYYRKMMDIPNVELYVAELEGKIIVANIVSFYGETVTYLHGASDEKYRNAMAPFMLQWQSILDAKEKGCSFYDFGGVKVSGSERETKNKIQKSEDNNWAGITRFKMGFSKNNRPIDSLGSYDIVISPTRYVAYRILQRMKSVL